VKKGFISNAMNKAIRRDAEPKAIMAHILQGIEARILNIALDLFSNEILLLQHDGFTTIDQSTKPN
jgi:hypothetical protein